MLAALAVALVCAVVLGGCAWGESISTTDITDTSARLKGDISSYADGTTPYWFDYGATAAYGAETPHRQLDVTRDGTSPVDEVVSGPGSRDHVSLPGCAPSFRAPHRGVVPDDTFTTTETEPPPPPPDPEVDHKGYTGLRVWGHSIAAGTDDQGVPVGVSDLAHRYTSRLASALGIPEENDNVGGAAITDITLRGWSTILRNWHVPAADRPPYPQVPGGYNLQVVHYGENDLTRAGPSPNAPILNALRACLYHLRAAGSFEDDHSSVSGGGTEEPKTDRNSGAGTRRLSDGESFTISGAPLDSEWPGGAIALRFVVETGDEASVSVAIDGGPPEVVDLNSEGNIGALADQAGPVTKMLELDAGEHSIEVTSSATAGSGIQFDGYTLHPQAASSPQ